MATLPPLDPPAWFWGLMDAARGDPDRLRADLAALDREGLALFYGYWRDLATRLTDAEHVAQLPAGVSDETALEAGAWVVTKGREHYRQVAADPAAMPRESRPGTLQERLMWSVPGEVYDELFGEDLPTDVTIDWRPDGAAAPQ